MHKTRGEIGGKRLTREACLIPTTADSSFHFPRPQIPQLRNGINISQNFFKNEKMNEYAITKAHHIAL